jgi:hypothetical protein
MRAPSWKTSGVVAGAGDEVMIGKGNHPQLPHEIRLVIHESPALADRKSGLLGPRCHV